jgi:hypothetical protein
MRRGRPARTTAGAVSGDSEAVARLATSQSVALRAMF